jgi:hypothetical protein
LTTFSQAVPVSRAPQAVLTLPPAAFNPRWRSAPSAPVRIGVTLISPTDTERAKSHGAREALRMFPGDGHEQARISAFQDMLVCWLVARGTCDPDDASQPFDLWREAPEDIVPDALSNEGVKAVWDAIDKVAAETSPVQDEIDDAGIDELVTIATEALALMSPVRARRLRRLLGGCLTEMRGALGIEDEDEDEEV